MNFILDRLDADPDETEMLPSVVVFVISGGALSLHSEKLVDSLQRFLEEYGTTDLTQWNEVIVRLLKEESDMVKNLNQQNLSESVIGDIPDYFTLWENRN